MKILARVICILISAIFVMGTVILVGVFSNFDRVDYSRITGIVSIFICLSISLIGIYIVTKGEEQ